MSDRIHDIVTAICDDGEDPASVVMVIREALEAERADGRREGYMLHSRDGFEARRIAERRGELDQYAPPLDENRHHPEGDYDLWHLAAYIPQGREKQFVRLLNDQGVEVYRMWPVDKPEHMRAAMDELEESLRTPGTPGRSDG